MNLLGEIIAWSRDRPLWQQDALRRLVERESLTSEDIAELVALCKKPHGLLSELDTSDPVERLLDNTASGRTAQTESHAVTLRRLTHIGNVNALAKAQSVEFGPVGLTIVYGDNGAGKSGYARILKAACRARGGSEPVLINLLADGVPGTPSASISYCVGDEERQFQWTDKTAPPVELARVSVFDSRSAAVYVAKQTDVAFRPFGLDLFDRLARVCEQVKRELDREHKAAEQSTFGTHGIPSDTEAGAFLARLSGMTSDSDVERAVVFQDKNRERIDALRTELADLRSSDPKKRAQELRLQADRFERLSQHLLAVDRAFGHPATEAIAGHRSVLADAQRNATQVRSLLSSDDLQGTGSTPWRQMWDAAARFSELPYPAHPFPVLRPDARCLLCQQTLDAFAEDRFRRFAAATTSDAEAAVVRAHEALTAALDKVDGLLVLDPAYDLTLREVENENPGLCVQLQRYLDIAERHRTSCLGLDSAGPLDVLSPSPHAALRELAEALKGRAATLEGASTGSEIPAKEKELRELDARHALAQIKSAVLAEVQRRRRVAAYAVCLKETATSTITRKSTELTKRSVTDALCSAFQDELRRLRFLHVEIELAPMGGDRGALLHQVRFTRAPTADVPKVVSEGEARCLALAAFFAEVATEAHPSAVLFDDPVSSLDHTWRDAVARRLADAALSRQVVVFSHDITFVLSLLREAERVGATRSTAYLRREHEGAGVCSASLPWPAMGVKDRLSRLNDEWQRAEKRNRLDGREAYESDARTIYGLLREAWERAVEEVLLNQVIERFRKSVEPSRARYLHDIAESDLRALSDAMEKCSTWLVGHDQSPALNSPVPPPDELKADIDALAAWVKAIRDRRK